MTATLVFDAQDIVGEGAVYDERREALLWVAIRGKRIHRFSFVDGRSKVWAAPDSPTSIGLRMPPQVYKAISDAIQACQLNGQKPEEAAATASSQIDAFLAGYKGAPIL